MTDTNENNKTNEPASAPAPSGGGDGGDGKVRYIYHAMISFTDVAERQGEVTVAATDAEAARKLIMEMMGSRQDFKLIDLFADADVTRTPPSDVEQRVRRAPEDEIDDAEIVEMVAPSESPEKTLN